MKGATGTYLEGMGNDMDISSLIIALLRASGYPSRYVSGTIEVPIEELHVGVPIVIGVFSRGELPQPLEIIVRRPARGQLEGQGFEAKPEIETISDFLELYLVDCVAPIRPTLEQSFLIEPPARFTNRHPAGAVESRELLLRQRHARFVAKRDDVALEGAIDLFRRGSFFSRPGRSFMHHR